MSISRRAVAAGAVRGLGGSRRRWRSARKIRGPLWVDGQFTVRVRGPGPEPGRIVRVRRPFALIGRIPGADIRIDDPAVDGRHAFLLLDRRGVFGVDLLTRTGTRFAGAACGLGLAGGRRRPRDRRPARRAAPAPGRRLADRPAALGRRPPGRRRPVRTGRPDPRAARLARPALDARLGPGLRRPGRGLRHPDRERLGLEDALRPAPRPFDGLRDRPPRPPDAGQRPAGRRGLGAPRRRRPDHRPGPVRRPGRAARPDRCRDPSTHRPGSPGDLATTGRAIAARRASGRAGPPARDDARDAARRGRVGPGLVEAEVLDMLRQFQADTATLLEAQIDRIEALNREIASLRDEIRAHRGPDRRAPASRSGSTSPPRQLAHSDESATWLLDRLNTLETESRSTWKDLLGRIASTVVPGPAPSPGQILAPTRPEPLRRPILKSPRIDSERPSPTGTSDRTIRLAESRSWSDARGLPGPSSPGTPDSPSPPRRLEIPPGRSRVIDRIVSMPRAVLFAHDI